MLKKWLRRWGIAGKSVSRPLDPPTSGKTASLASPEPSSCSSSETCSFSSASSYAENKGDRRSKIRNIVAVKKSDVAAFACSSPVSSSSSCGKQFREMQTQTDLSPLLSRKPAAVCAYCMPTIPFCRNNQQQSQVAGSACCPSYPAVVLPSSYLHPNQMNTCFDYTARLPPATRLQQFPLYSQSLSMCYGPCLGPPPVHGHHLTSPHPGCLVRQPVDPVRRASGRREPALDS